MQGRNNHDEVVNEINTSYTNDGQVITTSTAYDGRGNPVFQRVSIRRSDGTVSTTTVLGGKILP